LISAAVLDVVGFLNVLLCLAIVSGNTRKICCRVNQTGFHFNIENKQP
jgi:hypothetical protein